jgi:hypothetical protein
MSTIESRFVAEETADTIRFADGVSTSFTVNGIFAEEPPIMVVNSLTKSDIVGASFTAFTITAKLRLALAVPSLAMMVIVAVPN